MELLVVLSLVVYVTGESPLSSYTNEVMSHANWQYMEANECGIVKASPRITTGEHTNIETFPWLAQVLQRDKPNKKGRFTEKSICGAALINKRYLITAARCVRGKEKKIKNVQLGNDLKLDKHCEVNCGKKARIEHIIIHNKYNRTSHENDIALIRLDEEIEYSFRIRPICLPRDDILESHFLAERVQIAGWGLDSLKTTSQVLKFMTLPMRDRCACESTHKRPLDERQWCIGAETREETCDSDLGSPVVWSRKEKFINRHFVIGVTTFRNKKTSNGPSVYTNLNHYVKWILENIYDYEEDEYSYESSKYPPIVNNTTVTSDIIDHVISNQKTEDETVTVVLDKNTSEEKFSTVSNHKSSIEVNDIYSFESQTEGTDSKLNFSTFFDYKPVTTTYNTASEQFLTEPDNFKDNDILEASSDNSKTDSGYLPNIVSTLYPEIPSEILTEPDHLKVTNIYESSLDISETHSEQFSSNNIISTLNPDIPSDILTEPDYLKDTESVDEGLKTDSGYFPNDIVSTIYPEIPSEIQTESDPLKVTNIYESNSDISETHSEEYSSNNIVSTLNPDIPSDILTEPNYLKDGDTLDAGSDTSKTDSMYFPNIVSTLYPEIPSEIPTELDYLKVTDIDEPSSDIPENFEHNSNNNIGYTLSSEISGENILEFDLSKIYETNSDTSNTHSEHISNINIVSTLHPEISLTEPEYLVTDIDEPSSDTSETDFEPYSNNNIGSTLHSEIFSDNMSEFELSKVSDVYEPNSDTPNTDSEHISNINIVSTLHPEILTEPDYLVTDIDEPSSDTSATDFEPYSNNNMSEFDLSKVSDIYEPNSDTSNTDSKHILNNIDSQLYPKISIETISKFNSSKVTDSYESNQYTSNTNSEEFPDIAVSNNIDSTVHSSEIIEKYESNPDITNKDYSNPNSQQHLEILPANNIASSVYSLIIPDKKEDEHNSSKNTNQYVPNPDKYNINAHLSIN